MTCCNFLKTTSYVGKYDILCKCPQTVLRATYFVLLQLDKQNDYERRLAERVDFVSRGCTEASKTTQEIDLLE